MRQVSPELGGVWLAVGRVRFRGATLRVRPGSRPGGGGGWAADLPVWRVVK
jgi:hypothetical protein